jgi:hypothetical protein
VRTNDIEREGVSMTQEHAYHELSRIRRELCDLIGSVQAVSATSHPNAFERGQVTDDLVMAANRLGRVTSLLASPVRA